MTYHHWGDLPGPLQQAAEQRCRGIEQVTPVNTGINNDLSCTLETGDGPRFIKGLQLGGQSEWMYRNEITAATATGDLAPTMRWHLEAHGWILLCWDHQPGHHPDLTPGSPDLPRIAATLHHLADQPAPQHSSFADQAHRWERMQPWRRLAQALPDDLHPWTRKHLHDFADNETHALALLDGDALAHTDIHEFNCLIDTGRAYLIDWALARRAAPWMDAELLTHRLVAAGHSCEAAEQWRREHLPFADLPHRTRTVFAAEMLGAWTWLTLRQPHRRPLKHLAEAARQWTQYLTDHQM